MGAHPSSGPAPGAIGCCHGILAVMTGGSKSRSGAECVYVCKCLHVCCVCMLYAHMSVHMYVYCLVWCVCDCILMCDACLCVCACLYCCVFVCALGGPPGVLPQLSLPLPAPQAKLCLDCFQFHCSLSPSLQQAGSRPRLGGGGCLSGVTSLWVSSPALLFSKALAAAWENRVETVVQPQGFGLRQRCQADAIHMAPGDGVAHCTHLP